MGLSRKIGRTLIALLAMPLTTLETRERNRRLEERLKRSTERAQNRKF